MVVKNYSEIKRLKDYKTIKSEIHSYKWYIFDTIDKFLKQLYGEFCQKYKNDEEYRDLMLISLGWSLGYIKKAVFTDDKEEIERLITFTIDEGFEWYFG